MHEDSLRRKLKSLVIETNTKNGNERLRFDQQPKNPQNMSILGGNGRLRVQPRADGFSISLSGKLLEHEIYGFLRNLFQRECDGYIQTNAKEGKKNKPSWNTDSLEALEKAVYRYAATER